jgi:hypothetical protein
MWLSRQCLFHCGANPQQSLFAIGLAEDLQAA